MRLKLCMPTLPSCYQNRTFHSYPQATSFFKSYPQLVKVIHIVAGTIGTLLKECVPSCPSLPRLVNRTFVPVCPTLSHLSQLFCTFLNHQSARCRIVANHPTMLKSDNNLRINQVINQPTFFTFLRIGLRSRLR